MQSGPQKCRPIAPLRGLLPLIHRLTLITLSPDGQGEISNKSRPLKPGEAGEWILLDGVGLTPGPFRPFP